jgi:hypothetical protein
MPHPCGTFPAELHPKNRHLVPGKKFFVAGMAKTNGPEYRYTPTEEYEIFPLDTPINLSVEK